MRGFTFATDILATYSRLNSKYRVRTIASVALATMKHSEPARTRSDDLTDWRGGSGGGGTTYHGLRYGSTRTFGRLNHPPSAKTERTEIRERNNEYEYRGRRKRFSRIEMEMRIDPSAKDALFREQREILASM